MLLYQNISMYVWLDIHIYIYRVYNIVEIQMFGQKYVLYKKICMKRKMQFMYCDSLGKEREQNHSTKTFNQELYFILTPWRIIVRSWKHSVCVCVSIQLSGFPQCFLPFFKGLIADDYSFRYNYAKS